MERTEINIDRQRKLDFAFEKYRAKRKITKIQFEFALEKETKMIEPEQKIDSLWNQCITNWIFIKTVKDNPNLGPNLNKYFPTVLWERC